MPACLGRCVERLVASLHTRLADVHFDHLCQFVSLFPFLNTFFSEYEVARECVALRGEECAVQRRYFEIFTSGLEYACIEQRRSFDSFMPCVAHFANDSTNGSLPFLLLQPPFRLFGTVQPLWNVYERDRGQTAARSSQIITQLSCCFATSRSTLHVSFLGFFKRSFRSLKCYLMCTREEVNVHCENSGVKLVVSLHQFG